MCGRYNIIPSADAWISMFDLAVSARPMIEAIAPSYNIAPSQAVPIVRSSQDNQQLTISLLHWGLIPSWAKDAKIGNHTINARAETLAEKPSFRAAYKKRRCLVIANGFYEWRSQQLGESSKQPFHIHPKTEQPLAFAGLWERWIDPEDGREIESCSIITTVANQLMTNIHHRMPVILEPENFHRWLGPTVIEASDLLRPCSDELLQADAISTFVNNPKNNDVRCIEPRGI